MNTVIIMFMHGSERLMAIIWKLYPNAVEYNLSELY